FMQRVPYIQDTIKRYAPDLIALQEVRNKFQLDILFKTTPHFEWVYTHNELLSYPDPILAFDPQRYEKIRSGNFWLGPRPEFNFGWKLSLPRQVVWVKLKDKITGKIFIFMSSHFDNRIENLQGSAIMVGEYIKELTLPTIFAADTNL